MPSRNENMSGVHFGRAVMHKDVAGTVGLPVNISPIPASVSPGTALEMRNLRGPLPHFGHGRSLMAGGVFRMDKAAMLKKMVLLGLVLGLSACASSTPSIVRSVAGTDGTEATRKGILEALNGGLFDDLQIENARRAERVMALEAEYRALEHTPAGQTVAWRSDKSDLAGEVIAAQPYRVGSQDCRTYTHTVSGDGAARSARGTACRNTDGSWTPLT